TRVTIPAPFLTYRPLLHKDLALLYDPVRNQWLSRTRPARTVLRFRIPAELLPLRVERAVLEVDVNAPARLFEVFAGKDDRSEVLAARTSPVGRFRFVIDRPDVLQPDAAGGVHLGLAIGGAAELPGKTGASSPWQIADLQLELMAQIQEN